MFAYSQILLVAGCTVGLVLFVFVNYFVIRRLQYEDRRIRLSRIEPRIQTVVAEVVPQRSLEEMEREKEMALFYMHQEQVRRLVDAKIEVIRNTAETNNRIALIRAEVVKMRAGKDGALADGSAEPTRWLVQADDGSDGRLDADPGDAEDDGRPVPVTLKTVQTDNRVSSHLLGALSLQQDMVRSETVRQLAELEEQLSVLPGKSMSGWVQAQFESSRD